MAAVAASTTAAEAVSGLTSLWRTLRVQTVKFIADCNAGSSDPFEVAGWLTGKLATYKTLIATYVAVPGVAAAMVEAYPGKYADEAAATAALGDFSTAINTWITYLETTIPPDASGRVSVEALTKNGSGTSSHRTITNGAQVASFKAALEAFRDSIDVS